MSGPGRLVQVRKTHEQRKERRVKTNIPANLNGSTGVITDMSLGGCKFETDDADFDIGMEADIRMSIGPDRILSIPGEVVAIPVLYRIFGIRFTSLNSEQFDVVEKLITGRAFRSRPAPAPTKKKSGLFSW